MPLNLKASLKTALAFITDQGLKDSYRDFTGGWPMPEESKIDSADEGVGAAAVGVLARMVLEGTLSEGQVCQMIGIDRYEFRRFMAEVEDQVAQ